MFVVRPEDILRLPEEDQRVVVELLRRMSALKKQEEHRDGS